MYYELDEKIINLIKSGNLQEALEELQKIESTDERVQRVINLKKAKLASELGKVFLANFYIILAKDASPKDSLYYSILSEEAKIALREKDYEHALACCEEALNDGVNNNGIIYLTKGHVQERIRNYYEAIKNYRMAIQATDSPSIKQASYYSVAMLEFALGGFSLAEIDIKSLIKQETINEKTNKMLIGLYLRQGKYEEAKTHLEQLRISHPEIPVDSSFDIIIAKNLNLPLPKRNQNGYFARQLIKYSKEEAIKHIKEGHAEQSSEDSFFSSNVDIDELFEAVVPQLTEDAVQYEALTDIYMVPYQNIGYDKQNNIINALRIVTLPGTKEIITMYPCATPIINDKNYAATKSSHQRKYATRIARFNARLEKTNQNK